MVIIRKLETSHHKLDTHATTFSLWFDKNYHTNNFFGRKSILQRLPRNKLTTEPKCINFQMINKFNCRNHYLLISKSFQSNVNEMRMIRQIINFEISTANYRAPCIPATTHHTHQQLQLHNHSYFQKPPNFAVSTSDCPSRTLDKCDTR